MPHGHGLYRPLSKDCPQTIPDDDDAIFGALRRDPKRHHCGDAVCRNLHVMQVSHPTGCMSLSFPGGGTAQVVRPVAAPLCP